MARIPATVITGFLGAGKTSLVRHMIETITDKRIALIINEFGDVGVDGDILRGCGDAACKEEDIVELANGCLCCTVADDFVPTIEALLDRPNPPEHIIIETSGLALPKAFGESIQLAKRACKRHCRWCGCCGRHPCGCQRHVCPRSPCAGSTAC